MIAIIGGGWFGCHIGYSLKKSGIPVTVFEQNNTLFGGASGYNQNRLHLGFHYPRSAITRSQSREGFYEFLEHYPTLSEKIDENIYAIVKNHSFLDFDTYKLIMLGSGLAFEEVETNLNNVEGSIRCDERVICTNRAREYFTHALGDCLELNSKVDSVYGFDAIINCTYQTWNPTQSGFRYEPCVVLIYSSDVGSKAVTLMDGPFHSVYPFENGLFTAYSVKLSRLDNFEDFSQAVALLATVNSEKIAKIRSQMEREICLYYPDFAGFKFEGIHKSIRSYSINSADARTCSVRMDGNMIHVMSGKIDSIFHAEREVRKCLNCCLLG